MVLVFPQASRTPHHLPVLCARSAFPSARGCLLLLKSVVLPYLARARPASIDAAVHHCEVSMQPEQVRGGWESMTRLGHCGLRGLFQHPCNGRPCPSTRIVRASSSSRHPDVIVLCLLSSMCPGHPCQSSCLLSSMCPGHPCQSSSSSRCLHHLLSSAVSISMSSPFMSTLPMSVSVFL